MEKLSALLAPCEGNLQVNVVSYSQRASNAGFDIFFDVRQTFKQTLELLVIWDAMMLIVTSS